MTLGVHDAFAASMGPGICVPGRSTRAGRRSSTCAARFNGAGHLCARKAARCSGRPRNEPSLQWGRASVCPEGSRAGLAPARRAAASMGPGICVPGRQPYYLAVIIRRKYKLQWGRASVCPEGRRAGRGRPRPGAHNGASMGPGICVPGRPSTNPYLQSTFDAALQWGRASVCPEGGHHCVGRGRGTPRFNGAGHLCARKVEEGRGRVAASGMASMGPGICVPGRARGAW